MITNFHILVSPLPQPSPISKSCPSPPAASTNVRLEVMSYTLDDMVAEDVLLLKVCVEGNVERVFCGLMSTAS